MKGGIRSVFSNALILLMTVFLCLPCSAKKEIKQAFNIPVEHLGHPEKPDKAAVCQHFTRQETRKTSVSFQKKTAENHSFRFSITDYPPCTLQHKVSLLKDIKAPPSVPLFILHEQYLI